MRHEDHHATLPAFQRLLDTPTITRRGDARLFGYPLYRSLLKGNLLQQPYAIRREVFQQLGGYDEQIRYCEDWDLYLRIAQSFPVAVSDVVISEHRIEGTNLHLTESTKQEVMYERVLRKRQASHRRLQFQERAIVRRKLAAIFKGQGDRAARSQSYIEAWKSYFQSFLQRPFDHVVCARLLLWLPKLVGTRG